MFLADLDKVLVVRTISNGNVDKVLGNHSAFPKLIKHSQLHLNTRTFCRTTCLLIKSAVPPLSSDSIDDFRASEQKNEQEFTSQQRSSDSQEKSQKSNDEEDQKRVQEVRCRILDAALEHVSSHGWSREAITIGAEKCGYPGIAHGMFPNGGAELVHHFYTKCNNQLIDQLREEESARGEGESTPIPTEFISRAIKLRLQMIQPYIDSWPKALAILTLPQNAPTSLAQLLTLIDDICYYAGDRSVDVSIFKFNSSLNINSYSLLYLIVWMVYEAHWCGYHLQNDRTIYASR